MSNGDPQVGVMLTLAGMNNTSGVVYSHRDVANALEAVANTIRQDGKITESNLIHNRSGITIQVRKTGLA